MSKNMSEKLKTPEAKLSPADLDFEKIERTASCDCTR